MANKVARSHRINIAKGGWPDPRPTVLVMCVSRLRIERANLRALFVISKHAQWLARIASYLNWECAHPHNPQFPYIVFPETICKSSRVHILNLTNY